MAGKEFLFAKGMKNIRETINYILKNYKEIQKKSLRINFIPRMILKQNY